MPPWGKTLAGGASRPQLVQGVSIPPDGHPTPEPITYSSFQGGINVSDSPEDVGLDCAIFSTDMEVERDDSLVPAPGFLPIYGSMLTPTSYFGFQQAGLDFTAELICVQGGNAGFSWNRINSGVMAGPFGGLPATGPMGWNACSIAGSLILSNGIDFTATHAFGANAVVNITAQIIAAKGFALQFGRAFAVGVTPAAGTYQALGVSWNGSSGAINDWTGANSGSELLIGAETEADACMAVVPLGFDLLVFINRHSIWFGYPTGVANRPADFRPRTQSIGSPYGGTAVATPLGVMFLSDEGVMLVTSASITCISDKINASLLPLTYGATNAYSAIWSPYRNRYILRTPTGLWIYTIPEEGTGSTTGRWTFRSFVPLAIVEWTDQSFSATLNPSTLWVLADSGGAVKVGTETYVGSPFLDTYYGASYVPLWRMPFASKDSVTMNYTTLDFEIEYTSTAPVTIKLQLTDANGMPSGSSVTKVLPSTGGVLARNNIPFIGTGMGASMQFSYLAWANNAGSTSVPVCRVRRLRQLVTEAGPNLTSL